MREESSAAFRMEVRARVPGYSRLAGLAQGVLDELGIEKDEEEDVNGAGSPVSPDFDQSQAAGQEEAAYNRDMFPTRMLLPDSESLLPQIVRDGAISSGTRVFTVYRPFKLRPKIKGQLLQSLSADVRGAQELLVLWARRTHLASMHPFPGCRRRSPVLLVEEELLTPLDIALEQVSSGTLRLKDATREAASKGKEAAESLSMRLQGVIDAGVGGGASRFPAMLQQSY